MTTSKPLPNFLILGAPKAGTTSVYHALRGHPDVFMPRKKELRFFSFEGQRIDPKDPVNRGVVTDLSTYESHFEAAAGYKAVGEASPAYLSSERAPAAIKRVLPNARMIAIVREPVSRAYSHFLYAVQQGYEPDGVDFLTALREPRVRHRGFTRERPYLADSMYGRSLARYFNLFRREQFLIIRYEDLQHEPEQALKQVCDFLDISDEALPTVESGHAASGIPRRKWMHRLLRSRATSIALKSVLGPDRAVARRAAMIQRNLHRPKLSEDDRRAASRFFEEDIGRFQELSGFDLSSWRSEERRLSEASAGPGAGV